MSFNVVLMPPQSPGAAETRQSDLARLVESLNVELASEKIDLPSFPDVATRVRRALTNELVDVDLVVRIVSAEPALAARLMQLANSAALNPGGRRFNDLRSAVSRIGFNMARSAAIAFAMSQLRRAEAYKSVSEPLSELWQQSAHVAAMSHVVARKFTRINADTALLTGLLQGVGKLYLLTRAARFPALLSDADTYQRLVAEWHVRLAQAILRNWEMSDEIVDAIGAVESTGRDHPGTTDLGDVLAVAGALASLAPAPRAEDMLFLDMPAARRMKLDAKACSVALAESHEAIASLRQALQA
jgi:HD-like signal output (HDOD) protein